MAFFTVHNVKIAGISAAVPKQEVSNYDYERLNEQEKKLLVKTIGVEKRRVAPKGLTTSDLCLEAAQPLLHSIGWNKNEIQLLIFVSQSGDYYLPATAVILQDRLGLEKSCIAFDINLGCSGYVYGLSTIGSMMSSGGLKKALLMVGDIASNTSAFEDKSTYPLFGDAGTVTALEYDPSASPMSFILNSDGSGYKAIIIEDGGARNLVKDDSLTMVKIGEGIERSRLHLALNGVDVFNFSITEVPASVKEFYEYTKTSSNDYDHFVMHQANLLMNETIRKKLGIDASKVPYTLSKFGNTSSASIPLTMVTELNEALTTKKLSLLLSGFGVGLSWGTASVVTERIICLPLVEV